MSEPLTLNSIERLGRALFAQLSPLTGARATGTMTVTAAAGSGGKVLYPNAYLLPVVDGQLRDDLLFKTTANPDALGGIWTVPAGTTASVGVTSNVGGSRHNLGAATVMRFDPPLDDFDQTATLDAVLTGGNDASQLVKRVAFFEDLDSTNPAKDIFAAKLGEYPALMLVWLESEPAEGVTAGLRQGSTRGGRRVRFMRESFILYVIVGRLAGDTSRRQDGLVVAQAVTRLLTDRQRNLDGEQLSSVGSGVEVNRRRRARREERHYIYSVELRVNQVLQPMDEREFAAWLTTRYQGSLPVREAPEPTEPIIIVDGSVEMPHD